MEELAAVEVIGEEAGVGVEWDLVVAALEVELGVVGGVGEVVDFVVK